MNEVDGTQTPEAIELEKVRTEKAELEIKQQAGNIEMQIMRSNITQLSQSLAERFAHDRKMQSDLSTLESRILEIRESASKLSESNVSTFTKLRAAEGNLEQSQKNNEELKAKIETLETRAKYLEEVNAEHVEENNHLQTQLFETKRTLEAEIKKHSRKRKPASTLSNTKKATKPVKAKDRAKTQASDDLEEAPKKKSSIQSGPKSPKKAVASKTNGLTPDVTKQLAC